MKPIAQEAVLAQEPAEIRPDPADGWTLERLYQERAPHVFRALRALGVRDADLADVVHDVFLTVHRRRSDVRIYASVRAWVHGICVRTAANYRRKSRHARETLCAAVPETPVDVEPNPGAAVHAALARAPRAVAAGSIYFVGPLRARLIESGAVPF